MASSCGSPPSEGLGMRVTRTSLCPAMYQTGWGTLHPADTTRVFGTRGRAGLCFRRLMERRGLAAAFT
jgi:hypothetical protein